MTTTIEKVRLRRNTATRPIAHPETELAQISDMSSFVRGVCESTDAASFRAAIAATAENCGGIVAQSLTTNGYVKFANGLILQWAWGTQEDVYNASNSPKFYRTYFPITFTNDYPVGSIFQLSGTSSSRLVKGYIDKDNFSWALYEFNQTKGITAHTGTQCAHCVAIGW